MTFRSARAQLSLLEATACRRLMEGGNGESEANGITQFAEGEPNAAQCSCQNDAAEHLLGMQPGFGAARRRSQSALPRETCYNRSRWSLASCACTSVSRIAGVSPAEARISFLRSRKPSRIASDSSLSFFLDGWRRQVVARGRATSGGGRWLRKFVISPFAAFFP